MKKASEFCLIILLILISVSAGYSQSRDKTDSICWCRDYKLKWLDFTGVSPVGDRWQAMSGISIKIDGYREGGLPTYNVVSFFVKDKSWVKDTSESLLEHERLHFEIAEVYARKMRYAVDSLRIKGETEMSTYRSVINSLYFQWEKWGNVYDKDSEHGLRTSKQKEWALKVRQELNALERYAIKCPSRYIDGLVVSTQRVRNDSIYWTRNYKLKWSDFQGEKPSKSLAWHTAGCAASIYSRGYMDSGYPNYTVTNCFMKKLSWVTDSLSKGGLAHEQLHFDIAELHARRIRKGIEELRKKRLKKYASYELMINSLLDDREAMDIRYDKETSHSMNLEKQEEWRKKIAKELGELKKYASEK